MHKVGDEIHITTEEARGGSTPHIVRYMLAISLALAILALSAVWIIGALSQRPANGDPVTAEEHALGG
jgi:hypothetical protein